MKIYLSADIEGVTGAVHWDECAKTHADYAEFRAQMTREVAAACRGALAAGAQEILVKDAHATGRNLLHRELPPQVRLVRGWAGHPQSMVQGLDPSFAAVMMIGYHSPAGSGGNPLAHTMSGKFVECQLNGAPASEFLLHAHVAAASGVPVALVAGDAELCRQVKETHEGIATVATGRGMGNSMVAEHPDEVVARIEAAAAEALSGDPSRLVLPIPDRYELRLRFREPAHAFRASQYPGMALEDDTTTVLVAPGILDAMRALMFVA